MFVSVHVGGRRWDVAVGADVNDVLGEFVCLGTSDAQGAGDGHEVHDGGDTRYHF